MKAFVLGALTLVGLAVPAVAQEYYITRDPDTRECTVVETTTTIEPRRPLLGRIFGNRVEAERQISVLCEEDEPAPVVIERDRDPVVIERDRDDAVVIERERDPVVIERDRGDAVVIDGDDGPDGAVVIERD